MIFIEHVPPNHAPTTFHRVNKVTTHPPFTMATVEVVSYANEAAYLASASHTWAERYQVPLVDITSSVIDHVENWLVDPLSEQPDGKVMPFGGGIIVVDKMQSLDNAKERVWARVKFQRQARLAEPFMCNGLQYDANVQNITGAAVAAFMKKTAGMPYEETFTLYDNTEAVLDADQMIAVGLTLSNRNSQIYETARVLRARIFAIEASDMVSEAEAIALVAAVVWP
jgi:hypothetical protein